MKPWAVSALIFLLAATPAIAQERWMSLAGRDHPLAGSVWDVAAAAFLSAADLIAKLSAANIVLLGETHTNPDHHRLQARIVAGLGRREDSKPSPSKCWTSLRRRRWRGILMRSERPRVWAGRWAGGGGQIGGKNTSRLPGRR